MSCQLTWNVAVPRACLAAVTGHRSHAGPEAGDSIRPSAPSFVSQGLGAWRSAGPLRSSGRPLMHLAHGRDREALSRRKAFPQLSAPAGSSSERTLSGRRSSGLSWRPGSQPRLHDFGKTIRTGGTECPTTKQEVMITPAPLAPWGRYKVK